LTGFQVKGADDKAIPSSLEQKLPRFRPGAPWLELPSFGLGSSDETKCSLETSEACSTLDRGASNEAVDWIPDVPLLKLPSFGLVFSSDESKGTSETSET
jgi:hypothetical protein